MMQRFWASQPSAQTKGRSGAAAFAFFVMTGVSTFSLIEPAFAQTKIEQMIVTAQKRAQDIQTVPASVSAFSGTDIQERQLKTFEDLTRSTPNLQWAYGSGQNPTLAIRGVSPDGISGTIDPSVAVHVDGVYQARVYSMQMVMFDLENVEVLRGPQGTVYGRNANAGVVNFNTAKPSDIFEGSATVFAGNHSRYGARGYVSGPIITDKLSVRVAAMVDRQSGWGKSLLTGNKQEGSYDYGARLSLRATPTEDLTVDLILSEARTHGSQGVYQMSPFNVPGAGTVANQAGMNRIAASGRGTYTLSPWRNYAQYDPESASRTHSATAVITWDITPNVTFKSISGLQHTFYRWFTDLDTMEFDQFYIDLVQSSSTFSQEFNLNAKLFDRLDLVLGLYYLKDHNNGGNISTFQNGFPQALAVPGNDRSVPDIAIVSHTDQHAKSKAAFIDATLNITDDLRLLGGLRRTFDTKETIQNFNYTGVPNPFFPLTAAALGACPGFRVPDLDYTSTTGKVGLQYDLTADVMLYVQWQNGFKTGGYNPATCNNPFNPEKISSWEGGIKSTFLDNRVRLNVSIFSYDYKNLQLSRTVTTATGVFNRVDNAASAKIQGGEIEADAYITDDLKTDLSVGILDTEYQNYAASKFAGSPMEDLSGNAITKAPSLTLNAGLEYTMRLAELGDLKSRVEARYTSRIWYTPFHEVYGKQDPYTLFNAILTFTPDNAPYQIQLYGRNILNRAYRSAIHPAALVGAYRGYWGPARTFGAEATIKF